MDSVKFILSLLKQNSKPREHENRRWCIEDEIYRENVKKLLEKQKKTYTFNNF